MLLVFDKKTKQLLNNMGTNSSCPSGNLPYTPDKNEFLVKIHDTEQSELSNKIMNAYEFECVWDKENPEILFDIVVTKTIKEFNQENPVKKEPTETEKLQNKINELEEKISNLSLNMNNVEKFVNFKK